MTLDDKDMEALIKIKIEKADVHEMYSEMKDFLSMIIEMLYEKK